MAPGGRHGGRTVRLLAKLGARPLSSGAACGGAVLDGRRPRAACRCATRGAALDPRPAHPRRRTGLTGGAGRFAGATRTELAPPLVGAAAGAARAGGAALPPSGHYTGLVCRGILKVDPEQQAVMASLDALCMELGEHQRSMEVYVQEYDVWRVLRQQAEEAERQRRATETPSRLSLLRQRVASLRGGQAERVPPPQVRYQHSYNNHHMFCMGIV
jgi:hypothetical protein